MAVPILPGKTQQWKKFRDELTSTYAEQFEESRRKLGVHERTFFQSTPMGDLVIVTLEGDQPEKAFQNFASGNDEFTSWFIGQVRELHGIDLSQPPTEGFPELAVDSMAVHEYEY